ncbi:MAG: NAD(P)-binding domain-containing protein [Deltaproteobacteria bacterium]|nr:NAD(P)-binding domain-containing protein [Deltaproteobacteria bacterium]
MYELIISGIVFAIMAVAVIVLLTQRKKSEREGAERLRLAVAEGQLVPLSLHPVIDPTLCVGSFSCIKACPEGDIIGVVDGVATLVDAADCIGHARCDIECPVGAIKLVFGTSERGIDLPETDENFESSRAGVFIVGEISGMGLIKNALHQGLVSGKFIKGKLKKSNAGPNFTDVVVVGAGPAGIASAIACQEQGLSVRILEQESVGGAIAHYPRGKVVMTEQVKMPNFGPFGRQLLSKEDLMTEIFQVIDANKIAVEEGKKIVHVEGDAPRLTAVTAAGERIACAAVVLAIGLRGSPRKLDCPGEETTKVTYRLVDPEQYHGRNVLVVGGGDSAVEAAIQLAEESTAKVSISYRQGAFSRCKPRNRDKIKALIDQGRVKAYFSTKVTGIDAQHVRLAPSGDDEKKGKGGDKPKAPEPPKGPPRPGTAVVDPSMLVGAEDDRGTAKTMMDIQLPEGAAPGGKQRFTIVNAGAQAQAQGGNPWRPGSAVHGMPGGGAGASAGAAGQPAAQSPGRSRTSLWREGIVDVIARGGARALDAIDGGNRRARVGSALHKMGEIPAVQKEGNETVLANDDVIVSIGGELPVQFLNSIKVTSRKYHGEEKAGGGGKTLTKAEVEKRTRTRLALILTALGVTINIALYVLGAEYYWLPLDERKNSVLHDLLRPSGLWGHGVGVAATLFMLANFIYALRKRWRPLKGKASIRTWLTFHMFVGIMSPLVIAFHAAFLVNNLLAVWTWVALAIVVATGIFGRFLFGLVPAQAGKMLAVNDLREQVNDMEKVLQPHIQQTKNVKAVTALFDMATLQPRERTLMQAVMKENKTRHTLVKQIDSARPLFNDDKQFNFFKDSLEKIQRARLQISFYATLKRVFRSWLVFHVVTAIFMVVLIAAHVAVTAYYGFGAFFFQGGQ